MWAAPLAAQQAQGNEIPDIFSDLGNVTERELRLEPEHDYPFEFLKKKSSIRFREDGGSIEAVIDHVVRMKIYTADPLELGSVALVGIPYYQADQMERIVNLQGKTFHPDGTVQELDTDTKTESQLNSRYNIVEFEMPDVEQGVVIEYAYTVIRRYIEELPDFYFAHRVPVREASVSLQNERYLRYDDQILNADFDVQYTEQQVDTSSVPLVFSYRRPEPVKVQTWRAENVPPVDASAYISSIDDIRGKVKFQISEFGLPRQPLENSWEFIAAQIRRNANPEATLAKQDSLKQLGEEWASRAPSAVAARDSIFMHVNRSVRYNGLTAVFLDDDLSHVLKGEPANQAEINMVLLAMLRGAGIYARPVYISGRDFGRINKSFPSIYQFNRMLVLAEMDGEQMFMDASFEYSYPGLIPIESYNEQGFMLNDDGYEWIDIRPSRSFFGLHLTIDADLTENGALSGRIRAVTEGYPSQQIYRQMESGEPAEEIVRQTFLDVYSDPNLSDATIEGVETVGGAIELTASFTIDDYAISFSDGIEFRPMVAGYLFRNPFEPTQRRVPITLDAPEQLRIDYEIRFPDGYSLQAAGETRSTRLRGAELAEAYEADGQVVRYRFEIDISRKEFPSSVYSQLRRMYERWVELSNETWLIEKQN
ncbi:MAG: DUF3857 domain-containing protein [Balneolaceae bacterium]